MLIPHKGHTDTIQVYSVTVMTHVKALQAGHSSQGTSEPITPAPRRASRVGLVDVLTAHYGSPGRLADYRRQFEKTTWMAGEDPLETLAVNAGDVGC